MDKQTVIFGAGLRGALAMEALGAENVAFFLDNNPRRWGTLFHGKRIESIPAFVPRKDGFHVLIAGQYAYSMRRDLMEAGITDFEVFHEGFIGYYDTEELILNPYAAVPEAESEAQWNQSEKLAYARREIYEVAEDLFQRDQALFRHIEIETLNRCNGVCSFCPVNRTVDRREKKKMEEGLFYDIVGQLEELDYNGRFTTFSNNEPLLDDRIVEWNRYARKHLPKARFHLFTNGTLLTVERFQGLMESLDELIIDNYNQELELIPPCREIAAYCEAHPELKKNVTIVLRKPREILTSRGGNAPNRGEVGDYRRDRCVLPFQQIIVRPDGKVSLCCNDAVGKYTLGDLTKERLTDVWYGPRFAMVRKCLYAGRENWGDCRHCDNFSLG